MRLHCILVEIEVRQKAEAEAAHIKHLRAQFKPSSPKQKLELFLENAELWKNSETEPVFVSDIEPTLKHKGEEIESGWLYQDRWYIVEGKFTSEEKKLLVMECADKRRQHFEKARKKFTSDAAREAAKPRDRIPEDVRIAVWRRDQGMCTRCKSRENLEYHHIIPRDKGGSNTVANIELLCRSCNRAKGNRIDELPLGL